ncbi:hypothetical protein, partial [Paenibacillus massiliensis]|uniref:hypothetical protein n=1 Tax=Paenibacillus massiliensis TaxID=225917 RepID=UPI001969E055
GLSDGGRPIFLEDIASPLFCPDNNILLSGQKVDDVTLPITDFSRQVKLYTISYIFGVFNHN